MEMRLKLGNLTLGLAISILLSGCAETVQTATSPNEIISNAIEKSETNQTYYMKSRMKIYENKKLINNAEIEEWHNKKEHSVKYISKSKNGHVSKSVSDGENIIFYSKADGKREAFKMESSSGGMGPLKGSQKENMMTVLKDLKKSHHIEMAGQGEITKRGTYHIQATPKDKGTFTGNVEFWMDKETWLPLKMITHSGDMKVVFKATQVNYSPDFNKDTFTIDIPHDVEIKDFKAINPTKTVNMAKAQKALEQPFLKVNTKAYELQKIELTKLESAEHTEITLRYRKKNVPQFTISVFPTPGQGKTDDSFFDGEETILIRDNIKASYMKEPIYSVMWDENGLRYSMLIDNPKLKRNEVIEILNDMILTEKRQ